ncbi:MAG: peptidase M23 [Pseudomonadota bacterium]
MRPSLRCLLGCVCALALATAGPAAAPQDHDPQEAALAAADRLDRAAEMLKDAEDAKNRVRALTETVRAYEAGLAALREGQRQLELREITLSQALEEREAEIARLLGTLAGMGRTGAPSVLLHPAGALGTARTGMILSEVTPALEKRAKHLRDELEHQQKLIALQALAEEELRTGLRGVETARAALSTALAERTDLPRRFTADPVKAALLLASSETLEEFASELDRMATAQVPGSLPGIQDRKGLLSMPVAGEISQRPGERDARGVTRPGFTLATLPLALVTTPVPATLRYHGPLLDYGTVVILEPQSGMLIVMAGLGSVFGEIGQVVPGGSPVGLMPGAAQSASDALLSPNLGQAGATGPHSLYIEVRENNAPVDPLTWFASNEG